MNRIFLYILLAVVTAFPAQSAQKKISELTSAVSAQTGDYLPVVSSLDGQTRKITINQILSLVDTSIADGAIIASKIASNAVTTAKILDSNVTTAKIADSAITNTKIAAGNVTATELGSNAVTTAKILDSNVTTAKIADSNVTTAKIADGAVTQAKRTALGQQLSSSSGDHLQVGSSETDVTNLSVTITTTGRPVWVGLVSDGSGNTSQIVTVNTSTSAAGTGELKLIRGSTEIGRYGFRVGGTTQSQWEIYVPASSVHTIDVVSAGTYTYKVTSINVTTRLGVKYSKLLAFEL